MTQWFGQSPDFDRRLRERFLALHEAAAQGEHDDWRATADGALALLILLDQFPRNAFRGTSRLYATDARARRIARRAIAAELDRRMEPELRLFFYLPFAHSENLDDQRFSVDLHRTLAPPWIDHALEHAAGAADFRWRAVARSRTRPADRSRRH